MPDEKLPPFSPLGEGGKLPVEPGENAVAMAAIPAPELPGNYTYILLCADNTLYTGWTDNLQKRLKAHNAGTGAKYTASRGPVKLVYYESFPTKKEAMQREWAIKQLTRAEKLRLIARYPAGQETSAD